MSGVANAIDFIREECLAPLLGSTTSENAKNHTSANQAGLRAMLFVNYALMAVIVLYTHDVALIQWRQGWSYLSFSYFLGSTFEFIGLTSLALKVHANKSVAGLSGQSISLFAIGLLCRVFTTLVFEGYLPVDKSGDMMVQIMDTLSTCVAMYLLYATQRKYVHTYEDELDTMPIRPILVSCAVSAYFIRADLNRNVLFDALWAYSLNLEVVQLLPQLYMMAKVGGVVDAATAHFVANITLSCLSRFLFWVWAIPGCKELSSENGYSWDMAMGGIYIIGAYILQTLISFDFMYYYVKAWVRGNSVVSLPKVTGEEI